jgi:hypothetical protein
MDAALSRVYSSAMFFKKIMWSFQGFISIPCQPSGRRGILSGHSSVSNIRPDDETFCPDAYQCLEAWTVQGFIRPDVMENFLDTLQSLRRPSVLAHPSGRRGYTVRTPFSVWQALGFLTQDTVMGRRLLLSRRCASYMEITCTSSTVRTSVFRVRTLQDLLW